MHWKDSLSQKIESDQAVSGPDFLFVATRSSEFFLPISSLYVIFISMPDHSKTPSAVKRAAFAGFSSLGMAFISAASYMTGDAETSFVAGSGALVLGWMAGKTYLKAKEESVTPPAP